MKKAKFLVSQLIIAVFLVFLLGSPALAEKPTDKGGKPTKTCKGNNCSSDSGDDGSTDGGSTDGGSTGDGSSPCPAGFVWLDLYGMCIPF